MRPDEGSAMSDDMWSKNQPSERGEYRVLWPNGGPEEVIHVDVRGRLFAFGAPEPIDIMQPPYVGTLFGARVPTAAELHQHAEAMHANVVARAEAERRCRTLEASLAHERRCHYALLDAAQDCGSAIHAALGLPPSDDVFQELGNVGRLTAMDSPEDSE
jgi:hypothetical protein